MPFATWVTVSQETWYSWSFLNIYKLQVEFCLWKRTNVSKMKPTMLASTSHILTTSWLFCNLLVWAVFYMINLRKHSFEFEDYKKPITLFLLLTISLLPFQNIFVCSGFFRATLFCSSKTRPGDQMPVGTASTVKTVSVWSSICSFEGSSLLDKANFDYQHVQLGPLCNWKKVHYLTCWDVDYTSDNTRFYKFTCFIST